MSLSQTAKARECTPGRPFVALPSREQAPRPPVPIEAASPPRSLLQGLAVHSYEILAGLRPLNQLSAWITPRVADDLAAMCEVHAERNRAFPDRKRQVPSAGSVTLSLPDRGICEATVVLHLPHRVLAVALRVEFARNRWRATAIHLLDR